MSFMFLRNAVVFCTAALLLALCADALKFLTFSIAAHTSGSFAVGAKPSGWIAIYATWWAISFLIALPFMSKLGGFPFRLP